MDDLSSKSTEELIDIIESKQEVIDNLEQSLEEANEACADIEVEIEEVTNNTLNYQEQEEMAVKCFYGGFICGDVEKTQSPLMLKSWLNFKMVERL